MREAEMSSQSADAPEPQAPQAPSAPVATAPAPVKAPPERKPLDQYKVLLHNDDETAMMFVVGALVEIVHLATPQAMKVMMEAHTSGVSLVTIRHMELAELLRDQLISKGLKSTIEKA